VRERVLEAQKETEMTRTIRFALFLAVLAPAFVLGGCQTRAQTGALIGSAAGAAGGYMIGNEMDKR
jgi:hypothetical protein